MSADTVDQVAMETGAAAPSSSGSSPRKGFPITRSRRSLLRWVLDNPFWIYGILRFTAPVFHIPFTNWYVVTRFGHVKEILAEHTIFRVPWKQKIVDLNKGGPAFVLGLDEPKDHREATQQLMRCFKREDVGTVARIAAEEAQAVVNDHIASMAPSERSIEPFDAIKELVIRVPTRLCRRYFGLPIEPDQEVKFALWAMDISTYLFADPGDTPALKENAHKAADRLCQFLDDAIRQAKKGPTDESTVLGRFITMQRLDGAIKDNVIRGHLIGMITGFVPTNTVAAGHMLNVLVGDRNYLQWRRSRFARPTRRAAENGDDNLLTRCLFETLRFLPINPGPFRVCHETYEVEGGGWLGRGSRSIPKDARLIASTQAAMFDGRMVERPLHFDPTRSRAEYMLLGSGLHACVGIHLAEAQIAQTLKPLLKQKNLRRAAGADGKLQRYQSFPVKMMVQFDLS
jgi:cytochrome P450